MEKRWAASWINSNLYNLGLNGAAEIILKGSLSNATPDSGGHEFHEGLCDLSVCANPPVLQRPEF